MKIITFNEWVYFHEKTNYSYSSTQINLPPSLSKEIIKWGDKHVSEEVLFAGTDNKGREDVPHVTIFYGLHADKPDDIRKLLKNTNSFEVELGKISIFTENEKFDVIKIEVFSDDLHRLNKLFSHLPSTQKFPTYKPHVTIAYIKKNQCKNLINCKDFVGKVWMPEAVVFSTKQGIKTTIPLKFKPSQMR